MTLQLDFMKENKKKDEKENNQCKKKEKATKRVLENANGK